MHSTQLTNYPKTVRKIPQIGYFEIEHIIKDLLEMQGDILFEELEEGFNEQHDLGSQGDHKIEVEYEINGVDDISSDRCTSLQILKITGFKLFRNESEVSLSKNDKGRVRKALDQVYPESHEIELYPSIDEEGDVSWMQ